MEKLEQSARKRQEKRAISERIPYYNSLLGPRSRTKRESENIQQTNTTLQDKKEETENYIKLLEDSFPNPETDNNIVDELHVRVKRNSTDLSPK